MRRGSPSRESADGPEGPTSAKAAARASLVLRPSTQGAHIKRPNGQTCDAEQNLGSPFFPRDFDHFRSLLGSPLPPLNSPPLFQPSPRRSTLPSPARPANHRVNGYHGTGVDSIEQFFSQSPALSKMLFSPSALTTNNIFDTPTHKSAAMPGELFTPTSRKGNPFEQIFASLHETGRLPGLSQQQQQPSVQDSKLPSDDALTVKQGPQDTRAGSGGEAAKLPGAAAKVTAASSDPLTTTATCGLPRAAAAAAHSSFQPLDGALSPKLGFALGCSFLGHDIFPGPSSEAGSGAPRTCLGEGGHKQAGTESLGAGNRGTGALPCEPEADGRSEAARRSRVLDFGALPPRIAAAGAGAPEVSAGDAGGDGQPGPDGVPLQGAVGGLRGSLKPSMQLKLPILPVLPAISESGRVCPSPRSLEAQQPLFPGYYPKHSPNDDSGPQSGPPTSGGSRSEAAASDSDRMNFLTAAAVGSGGSGCGGFPHGMVPSILLLGNAHRMGVHGTGAGVSRTEFADEEAALGGGSEHGGCGTLQTGGGMGMPPSLHAGLQPAGLSLLDDVRQGMAGGMSMSLPAPNQLGEQFMAGGQPCRASSGGVGSTAGAPRAAGLSQQHQQSLMKGESAFAPGSGMVGERPGLPPRINTAGGGGISGSGGAASTPSTLQRPHRARTAPNLFEGAATTRRPASLELDGSYEDPSWDPPLSHRTSGNGSGGNRQRRVSETTTSKSCRCKKSQCLKLYCDCFAAGQYCGACSCASCHNRPEYADRVQQRREDIAARDPTAFTRKIKDAKHKRGCNCRRSHCLKKYCECYQGGVKCGMQCTCLECENMDVPAPSEAGGGRGGKRSGGPKSGRGAAAAAGNRGGSRRNSGSGCPDDWAPSPPLPTTSGCSEGPSPTPSLGTMPGLGLIVPPLQAQQHHYPQQQQQQQHLALATCMGAGVGGNLASCMLAGGQGTPPAGSKPFLQHQQQPVQQQQQLVLGATRLEVSGAHRRSSLGGAGTGLGGLGPAGRVAAGAGAGAAQPLPGGGSQAQLHLMDVDVYHQHHQHAVQQAQFGALAQCGGGLEDAEQQQQVFQEQQGGVGQRGLLSSAAALGELQPPLLVQSQKQQPGLQAVAGNMEEGDKGEAESGSESEEGGQGRRKKSRRGQDEVKTEPDGDAAELGPFASGGEQDGKAVHSANASNKTLDASHQQPQTTNTCQDPGAAATATTAADPVDRGPAARAAGTAAMAAVAPDEAAHDDITRNAAVALSHAHQASGPEPLQQQLPHEPNCNAMLHDARFTLRSLGMSLDVMSPPPLSIIMGSLVPSDSDDDDDELGVKRMNRRSARERAGRGVGFGTVGPGRTVRQPPGLMQQPRGDVHLDDGGLDLHMGSDLNIADAMIAAIAGEAAGPQCVGHAANSSCGGRVGAGDGLELADAGGATACGGAEGAGVLLCGELLGGSLLDDAGHDFFMPGSEPNSVEGARSGAVAAAVAGGTHSYQPHAHHHQLLHHSEQQSLDLQHGGDIPLLRSLPPGPATLPCPEASAGSPSGQWIQHPGLRRPSRFGPSSRYTACGTGAELLPYDVSQHSWAASAAGAVSSTGFREHVGGAATAAASVHTLVSPVRTSTGPPTSRRKACDMGEEGACDMASVHLHATLDHATDDHRENWGINPVSTSSPSKQQRFHAQLQQPHNPMQPMQLLAAGPEDMSLYDSSYNPQHQLLQQQQPGAGGGGGKADAKGASTGGGGRGGSRGGRGPGGRARNTAEKELLKASALQYITQRLGGGGVVGGGSGGPTVKAQPMDADGSVTAGSVALAGQVPIQIPVQGIRAPHVRPGLGLPTAVPGPQGLVFPPPQPQQQQQQQLAGVPSAGAKSCAAGNQVLGGSCSPEGSAGPCTAQVSACAAAAAGGGGCNALLRPSCQLPSGGLTGSGQAAGATKPPAAGDPTRAAHASGAPVLGVARSGSGGATLIAIGGVAAVGTPAVLQPVRMGAMTKLGSGSTVFFSPNSNGGPRVL